MSHGSHGHSSRFCFGTIAYFCPRAQQSVKLVKTAASVASVFKMIMPVFRGICINLAQIYSDSHKTMSFLGLAQCHKYRMRLQGSTGSKARFRAFISALPAHDPTAPTSAIIVQDALRLQQSRSPRPHTRPTCPPLIDLGTQYLSRPTGERYKYLGKKGHCASILASSKSLSQLPLYPRFY